MAGLMSTILACPLCMLYACARYAELRVDNAYSSSIAAVKHPRVCCPLGHVHRANSAGPRRRVARQQERDKSQPVGQQVG